MRNIATKAWYKLDNAAKIFPPTSNRSETRVFRFSCELKEMVEPGRLQKALDKTMEKMPSFAYVLKRGLFWYYLEQSDLRAQVSEEKESVCKHALSRAQGAIIRRNLL